MDVPPACLPPPHNLGSPSTRWVGPCGEEYAPVDHGVHRCLTTKRQGQTKSSYLTKSKAVLFLHTTLLYDRGTCKLVTSWSLRLLRLLSPPDPLGIRACLEKVSFSPSSWQDERHRKLWFSHQLHTAAAPCGFCFQFQTLNALKLVRFLQVKSFH